MTETRRNEPQPPTPQERLVATLEAARRYDITGELTSEGIPDDYWNNIYPALLSTTTALRNPSLENQRYVRKALSSTKTYTQYCIDRWGGDYATNSQTKKHFKPILE